MNEAQAAVEARRAYQKEWRRKNKDKVRRHNENYWMRKAEQLIAAQKGQGVESNGTANGNSEQ